MRALDGRGCSATVAGTANLANGGRGLTAALRKNGAIQTALVDDSGRVVHLDDLVSIWVRRPQRPVAEHTAPHVRDFVETEWRLALEALPWTADALWVNDPRAERALERNKIAQLSLAEGAGLDVPETIYSSIALDVVAFAERFETVAVKTAAGYMRELADGFEFAYTQRLTAAELAREDDAITAAPILVQEYVEKAFEVRATIVGEAIFATRIDSQASDRTMVDWRRYDFAAVGHSCHELPESVAHALHQFMADANLQFAAVDLIVTPDGRYVFLEANPSGQWLWLEALTGAPITSALAKLLTHEAISAQPARARKNPYSAGVEVELAGLEAATSSACGPGAPPTEL